jgi:mannose-6-phosphate isomerase-like protein (cupin superfamily)
MSARTLRAFTALALLGGAACSKPKPSTFPSPSVRDVAFYPASMLSSLGDSLAAQGVPARVLGDRGDYQYVLVRRDASGAPERHARWTDIIVVQAGTATVLVGGTLSGQHTESPGEERGGTITGAEVRTVGAGDLLVIPAGLPHQVQLGSGGSVRYLVVKAPEPRR